MRRGSVSSWEPWARRNSSNMAQISGSRSEFMTSDLAATDIEYKREGGCFLSHKKTAAIIIAVIVGLVAAGVVGAYLNSWIGRSSTSLAIAENDEIRGIFSPSKFSVSPLIWPTLYEIELTPVIENGRVEKLKGRVTVHFTYNESKPLSQLVLNAKNIVIYDTKLFSHRDPRSGIINSRHKRDDRAVDGSNSSDVTTTTTPATFSAEVTPNDASSLPSTVPDYALNATSVESPGNETALNTSNENKTIYNTSSFGERNSSVVIFKNVSNSGEGEGLEKTSVKRTDGVRIAKRPRPGGATVNVETPKQRTEILVIKNETENVDGFYVIYSDTEIKKGDYSVEITYEAQVDGESTSAIVYDSEGQTKWLLASKLRPFGARMLFPRFNDPSFGKPRFSLSVARPDTSLTLANMPLRSSDPLSDGWLMDHFEESLPLASDKLAFVIGDLQPIRDTTVADTGIPITFWDRSNKINETDFIVDKIVKVTHSLTRLFSTPYYMPKLDVVAIPGPVGDGTGSTGLITIREPLFYLTEKSSAITKELAVKNLIKLMAEQWLGGLVSARTLSESWFLEGSLIYLQNFLADEVDPSLDSSNAFGIVQRAAFETDSYDASTNLKIKFSATTFELTRVENIHKKGACLIRMLHNVISDSGFRNGYNKFLSRWKNSSAGVSDFWNAMSDKAEWLPEGVSLTEFAAPWVDQGGFPVVAVTRDYKSASAVVGQEQFVYDDSTERKSKFWYVPLTYVIEGDDWSSPRKTWLKKEEKMTLKEVGKRDEKKWVVFNVNQTGYYRVNYDLDNWKLLSSALNSTFEKFPVTTRTSLVDDSLSLAWGGRLEYPTALNLIRYLREKETHHSPWTVALENMIKLNNLLHDTPAYSSFQEFMVNFISPIFKRVTTSTGEESRIKLMAIKWACLIDNPECQSYMRSLSNVSEYLDTIQRCSFAKFGGKAEWSSLISETLNTTDIENKFKLLSVLPCFRVEWILQSLLDDMVEGKKFDEREILILLRSFGENPAAARSAFKFARRNWNEIFRRYSKSYRVSRAFIKAAISGITDDRDLKDFQIFKEEYFDKLKFLGHTITVGEAEAKSRSSWLKTNLATVQAWLSDYARTTS